MDVERWGQQCNKTGINRYVAFIRAALAHEHQFASLANGAFTELANRLDNAPLPSPFDDGARVVSKEVRSLIDQNKEPFFMFANLMDAHGPFNHVLSYDRSLYDVPLSWNSGKYSTHKLNTEGITEDTHHHVEHTRELYVGAVDYLDRKVSDLVNWLNANTERETVVVITADHGENLGFDADEELLAHRGVLTEGLLHVPLIVVNAPDSWKDIDQSRYVSHCSLGGLLVGLANGEVPDITADRVAGERIGSNVPEAADEDERAEWDRMIRVVYDGETKYEWDSADETTRYRLDAERPNWQEPTEGDVPVEELEAEFFDEPLAEYKQRARSRSEAADVDDVIEDRLSDLGYV